VTKSATRTARAYSTTGDLIDHRLADAAADHVFSMLTGDAVEPRLEFIEHECIGSDVLDV
jgi:DNA gyrase/topoisomerase IV subunit B